MASKALAESTVKALNLWNKDHGTGWTLGENWSNVGTQFETFVNKYLFPKINETVVINVALGNRFEFLAKEVDFVGQFSEEYVILDSVPVAMNLSKEEELMLKRNYPKMATRLYGAGILKKTKFTINDNDVRLNFLTLADAVSYALTVYKRQISDINVSEEMEIRAMLTDYALNQSSNVRKVTSEQELFNEVFNTVLNVQNNSAKYNEANKASGGQIGRYTTTTPLDDLCILTNDKMKTYLLDTKLANTFQVSGLDLSKRIISFDDLGGVYKITKDVTITDAKSIEYMRHFSDYQVAIGDVIHEGVVFTYDVEPIAELAGAYEEIKPDTDLFAYVFDVNKIKYRRNTKDMITNFFNPEFKEWNYWLHYYSFKSISPFYNGVTIIEDKG